MARYYQPPIEFEQQHGLTGISGGYIYPKSADDLEDSVVNHVLNDLKIVAQFNIKKLKGKIPRNASGLDYYHGHRRDYLNGIFDELLSLNPVLSGINFDRNDDTQLTNVIRGIASGFNVSDINYYLKCLGQGGVMELAVNCDGTELERKALEKQIQLKLGENPLTGIGWVASPETLQKIWDQVQERVAERVLA